MGFYDVLDQVLELVCQRGRVTYDALKREFNLDDRVLEDLKKEIFFAHPQIVDEGGRGLVWTSHSGELESEVRRRLDVVLTTVTALLRYEKRVTYRALKHIFDVDDAFLEALRKELVFKRVARDSQGEGLVWTGEEAPHIDVVTTPRLPIDSDLPSTVAQKGSAPITEPPPPSAMQTVISDRLLTTSLAEIGSAAHDEGTAATLPPRRPAPEAERRQLTVMFCDLVGSTDLSVRLDPEDLREVVRAYQEMAAEVIQRYEGHIAQYLGDGLLVYFGYPLAHEDDAQRAVYTGLGISEAIATLNTRLEAAYGVQLAVRVGIHTGPVVVGEMGSGGRHENLALGETPNISARLEGLAQPNTVVISPVTTRLVQRTFVLEALGAHELKGVAEAMVIARVVGPRKTDQDTEDAATGGFAALVGRDEEMGLLLRRWEQSKEGLGHVVLITGEAGIGKSSLVQGLRQHVRQEGYIRVVFRCSPYTTHSALYPILEHIQRVLDWQPDDTADAKLAKLEHRLQGYRLAPADTVPLLASLLSLPFPENRYPSLAGTPQQQRQQTQDALVAWLLEEAERRPILAVWEDLHWADPSTLEILGLFIDQAPTAAMLHVLTFRPEFDPPWPTRSHMTSLTLNRLERLQVEAVVTRLAHSKALPAEVIEHVVTKTDGVPLFVEELTKMLLDSELLREDAYGYQLKAGHSTISGYYTSSLF